MARDTCPTYKAPAVQAAELAMEAFAATCQSTVRGAVLLTGLISLVRRPDLAYLLSA